MSSPAPGESATGSATAPGTFEAVLAALESEVQRLEKGELPLDDALKAFERGMSLSRRGEDMLAQAERKVEELLEMRSGRPVVGPFEPPA